MLRVGSRLVGFLSAIKVEFVNGEFSVFIKCGIAFIHYVRYIDIIEIKQFFVDQVRGFNILHGSKDGLVAAGVLTFPSC